MRGKDMKEATITCEELNAYVVNLERPDGKLPGAKLWLRVDNFKDVEVWVGDKLYVVAIIQNVPKTYAKMRQNGVACEKAVMKYLQAEDFVGSEYLYIGLQDVPVNRIPKGLTLDPKKKK
jgi:hypothetical protein